MAAEIEAPQVVKKHGAPVIANLLFSAIAAALSGFIYTGVMQMQHQLGQLAEASANNAQVNQTQADDIRANSAAITDLANAQARIEAQQSAAQKTLQSIQQEYGSLARRQDEMNSTLGKIDHRLTRVEDQEKGEGTP